MSIVFWPPSLELRKLLYINPKNPLTYFKGYINVINLFRTNYTYNYINTFILALTLCLRSAIRSDLVAAQTKNQTNTAAKRNFGVSPQTTNPLSGHVQCQQNRNCRVVV